MKTFYFPYHTVRDGQTRFYLSKEKKIKVILPFEKDKDTDIFVLHKR